MKVIRFAHDWVDVKAGKREFQIGLPCRWSFPEWYEAEVKKIESLSLEEFLKVYKGKFSELKKDRECRREENTARRMRVEDLSEEQQEFIRSLKHPSSFIGDDVRSCFKGARDSEDFVLMVEERMAGLVGEARYVVECVKELFSDSGQWKVEFDCRVEVLKENFEHVFGRPPKNREEFDEFVKWCKQGVEVHIDWDMLFETAKELMEQD